jgi:beta-lactamase superfamily II metal-dependent hydrolase
LAYLKANNVTELVFICMTHPDRDHFSGIAQLLEYFTKDGRRIRKFYDCGPIYEHYEFALPARAQSELKKLYTLLDALLDKKLIDIDPASFGLPLMAMGGAQVVSLGPDRGSVNRYVSEVQRKRQEIEEGSKIQADKNQLSIVIGVSNDFHAGLLCSDATKKCIDDTLERWKKWRKEHKKRVRFDFVKVSHHGSKLYHTNGLWKNFVVEKGCAAISAGRRYGLPHKEVIKSITSADKKVYCTCLSGCLEKGPQPQAHSSANTNISPLLTAGLDMISSAAVADTALHGRISWQVVEDEVTIDTEFPTLPIESF